MAPPCEDHLYFQHGEQFPFENDADAFSRVNAWWLSEAAMLAYSETDFAFPCFENAGFNKIRFLAGRSTKCYVAANRDFAIVAFRGTECNFNEDPEAMDQFLADLGVDVDIRRVDAHGEGKIHRGFNEALDEIWNDLSILLDELSQKDCRLWITGHSLGGALAVLAASRLAKVQGVYTYGAPRVGNRDFVQNYPQKIHSIVNNNDMVPHLPPYPYVDMGKLRYIDINGTIHAKIDYWQRLKDEIHGHLRCLKENVVNLKQGWAATVPDGLKDHCPLLYALHMWNNAIRNQPG